MEQAPEGEQMDNPPYYEENQVEGGYREGMPDPVFKKYISIMRRHMWPALTLTLIISSIGLIRAYRAAPIYEASAKILVERQGPRVMRFDDVLQPGASWWGPEYYRTQEELVRSRAVLEMSSPHSGLERISTLGFRAISLARMIRCSWPPERLPAARLLRAGIDSESRIFPAKESIASRSIIPASGRAGAAISRTGRAGCEPLKLLSEGTMATPSFLSSRAFALAA